MDMLKFPDREQRRELYMVAGLILAAFGFSHNLGYWPHGVSVPTPPTPSGGSSPVVAGMRWDQFLYALPLLVVGVLYFLGRRVGRLGPVNKRLDEIEKGASALATTEMLTTAIKKQNEIYDVLGERQTNASERVTILEDDRSKAIRERSAIEIRIASLSKVLQDIPSHVLRQNEFTELLLENRSCCIEYIDLRAIYPNHPAASKPFAWGWRPSRPEQDVDEVTKYYEQWAKHMEYHMNRVEALSDKWDVYRTRAVIFGWVKHWLVNGHDADGETTVSAISDLMRDIWGLRERYAADLERIFSGRG
jgi:hypothetical protein